MYVRTVHAYVFVVCFSYHPKLSFVWPTGTKWNCSFIRSSIHPTIHWRYNSWIQYIFSVASCGEWRCNAMTNSTQQLTLSFFHFLGVIDGKKINIYGQGKHSPITTKDTCSCWMQHKWMLNSHCVARFVFHCSLFFSIPFEYCAFDSLFYSLFYQVIPQRCYSIHPPTTTTTNATIVRLWIECNDFRNSRLVYLWVLTGKAMLNIHDTSNMITIRLLTTTAFYARRFNKMLPE